jgi:hypothetical protein
LDAIELLVEGLDGGFAVDHRDDDVAVVGVELLVDDDVIAIHDAGVDHALAGHAQGVDVAAEPGGDRDGSQGVLNGFDGFAGGYGAEDGYVNGLRSVGEPEAASDPRLFVEEPLFDECADVVLDGPHGVITAVLSNIPKCRRTALFTEDLLDIAQDLGLFFSQAPGLGMCRIISFCRHHTSVWIS